MNANEFAVKSMAATALLLVTSVGAWADGLRQTPHWDLLADADFHPYDATPHASLFGLRFRAAPVGQRNSWRTMMVVSGLVGVAGFARNSNALLVLGGAGELLSSAEPGEISFKYQSFHHGYDLMHTGPLYFGIGSFGYGTGRGAAFTRTGPYVQLSFSF
jgi:hypothetical protein